MQYKQETTYAQKNVLFDRLECLTFMPDAHIQLGLAHVFDYRYNAVES